MIIDPTLINFTKHDPLAVIGLAVVGIGSIASFHVLLKLDRSGYKLPSYHRLWFWTLPMQYLRARLDEGWPAWPAYLVWISFVIGTSCLVAGLFRLAD